MIDDNIKVIRKLNLITDSQKESVNFHKKFKKINPLIQELIKNEINNLNSNLKDKKTGFRYSEEIKLFCLFLYFTSPKAYRNLCKYFTWPSKATLDKHINSELMNTGISEEVLNYIDNLNLLDRDSVCILLVDEVHLTSFLSYDAKEDKLIGKCDLSGFGEDKKRAADLALTFMLVSYAKNIKIPIGFFFNHSTVSASCLNQIVQKVIVDLFKVNVHIKMLTCDQGTSNQSLAKLMNVSIDRPFFDVLVEEEEEIVQRTFFCFDIPHILKCIRNNFMRHGRIEFKYMDKKYTADWNHVKLTYMTDKKNVVSMIPKITEKHIYPTKFQQMKVKYAAQVLSRSFAAAMETMSEDPEINEIGNEAKGTILFLRIINDTFDILNNRSCCESKYLKEYSESFFNLIELESVIESMRFIGPQNIPCLKNLLLSIKSIILFQQELYTIYKIEYVLTKRLNQDALENFFAMLRFHTKENNNLRPQSFRTSFVALLFSLFFKRKNLTSNKNCEEDELNFSKIFSLNDSNKHSNSEKNDSNLNCLSKIDLELDSFLDHENLSNKINNDFLSSVSAYIAGFIIKKFESKKSSVCNLCILKIKNNEERYNFIKSKEKKGCILIDPCAEFVNYVQNFVLFFFDIINDIMYDNNLKKHLCTSFLESNTFTLDLHCKKQIEIESIQICFRTLIFHKLKTVNRELENRFKKSKKFLELNAKR